MKNVTISLDESLLQAARNHPQVKKSSLSQFISTLLKRELHIDPAETNAETFNAFREASNAVKEHWEWNRDEIHDR